MADDSDTPQDYTPIDPGNLSPEALRGLCEEFVTRDGTDYGTVEKTLEEKVQRLREQLEAGEATIVFDPATESVTIRVTREL